MNIESNFIIDAFKKLISIRPKPSGRQLVSMSDKHLIEEESVIGAMIFGETPPDTHIKFFLDQEGDWVLYKQKTSGKGVVDSVTLRYEVHPKGVLKSITRSNDLQITYEYINGQELVNFITATEMYHDRVLSKVYGYKLTDVGDVIYPNKNNKHVNSVYEQAA